MSDEKRIIESAKMKIGIMDKLGADTADTHLIRSLISIIEKKNEEIKKFENRGEDDD